MDQFKLSLEPFIATLNQALELVQTVPRFTTSNPEFIVDKKIGNEKARINEEIEKIRKDIEDLKAKTKIEEQELKLKEAKKDIVVSRIKDTRRLIKQLKIDESDLRRRYVESFSLVKHEPIDDDDIDLDGSESSATLPSPPRKKRKRVIVEDVDDDEQYLNYDGIDYEEDFDDEMEAVLSRVNLKEERKKSSSDILAQRVPVTNPWSCWEECPDFDFDISHVNATPKSFRIPKNSLKREFDAEDAPFVPPKRGRKPGITGGRRSLGGDADFGCRYCGFRSNYSQNLYRHISIKHPNASSVGESSSQGSMSSVSITVASSQASEDGSFIIPVKSKKGKRRKKWLIRYITPNGREFNNCTKNYVFECKECEWSSAYRPSMCSHIRKHHGHLLTAEEAAGPNKNIDWSKLYTKIKVKKIKVPNDEPSEDELVIKQESDWDYFNENDISAVNGSCSSGTEDVRNVNTMLQLTKPKRYPTKIRQPRVKVEDTYSGFKAECINIINQGLPLKIEEIVQNGFDISHTNEISFESEAAKEGFKFEEVTELCVIITSKAKKKFKTHCFSKKSTIKVPNNVSCDELSEKLDLISKCPNLNTLAISGLSAIHENLLEQALYSLPFECPLIEHFIVDDSIAIVKSYVDRVETNLIKILEVSNRPEDEHDMIEVVTNCPDLTAVYVEDISQALLQAVTPRVTHLQMTWITRDLLENFIKLCATSNIVNLAIDSTHVSVKRSQLMRLARSLPQLQSITFSWDIDMIHCLKHFSNLTSITWDSLPFDVEMDTAGGFIKEVPLDYYERDVGCEHSFTKYNSKRMLSAKVRLPADSVRYNLYFPSIATAGPNTLLPTLEECQQKKPPIDDDEKTEIDSQQTSINSRLSDNGILPLNPENNEGEQSSLSLIDLTLNDSPGSPDLPDSDFELFQEINEDPDDEYLEYRMSRAKLSLMILTQHLGNNLTLFNIQVSSSLPNDIFECFAMNCPNLRSLTITSRNQQTFSPQSFFLPQLKTLQTSGIIFRDSELLDILDNCEHLTRLILEDADNISSNAIRIVEAYSRARLIFDPPSSLVPTAHQDHEDPLSDFSKIQVSITTKGNESFDVVNVYDNLVFRFVVKKRSKILRKY